MRSAEPISTFNTLRTLRRTSRYLSPSMMSSAPRPSMVSLPAPPRRMLPSPQAFTPVRGQSWVCEFAMIPAIGVASAGTSASSPAIRSRPFWSSASHPRRPIPPSALGTVLSPLRLSLNLPPDRPSTSLNRSRMSTALIGVPGAMILSARSASWGKLSRKPVEKSYPAAPAFFSMPESAIMMSSPPSAS